MEEENQEEESFWYNFKCQRNLFKNRQEEDERKMEKEGKLRTFFTA